MEPLVLMAVHIRQVIRPPLPFFFATVPIHGWLPKTVTPPKNVKFASCTCGMEENFAANKDIVATGSGRSAWMFSPLGSCGVRNISEPQRVLRRCSLQGAAFGSSFKGAEASLVDLPFPTLAGRRLECCPLVPFVWADHAWSVSER